MQQRAAPAAPRGETVGEHPHDVCEILARQSADTARRGEQARSSSSSFHSCAATSATICCASTSSGCSGIVSASSSPRRTLSSSAAHSTSSSRESGNSRPFGVPFDRVARAADALQEAGDRARRAELADQIDVADIDAELQRGGGDQHLQRAAFQPLLGIQPVLLGHAAVMRGDIASRPAGPTIAAATRSAMRRVLTKTSVVRCASASAAIRS